MRNEFELGKTNMRAFSQPWHEGVVLLVKRLESGCVYYGEPVKMTKVTEDGAPRPPTMALSMEAAQLLMDDLWTCGIRPTEGHGSAGQLGATERHLADMQKLTFQFATELLRPPAPPQVTVINPGEKAQ